MHDPAPAIPFFQRALRKIRLAFETWYPWDQKRLQRKLRPLTLRLIEPDDIEWCEKLYIRNERCGLPEFGRDTYTEYLLSRKHLVLIAEDANGRIGTFGIHRIDNEAVYVCFVMVDPGIQKSGVGTTMLTSAIAMLGTEVSERNIVLTALPTSLPFYQKLGYVPFHQELLNRQPIIHAALGPITIPLIVDCQKMLAAAGVSLPRFAFPIPFAESPLPSGESLVS